MFVRKICCCCCCWQQCHVHLHDVMYFCFGSFFLLGGFAEVHLAEHKQTGMKVWINVLCINF